MFLLDILGIRSCILLIGQQAILKRFGLKKNIVFCDIKEVNLNVSVSAYILASLDQEIQMTS